MNCKIEGCLRLAKYRGLCGKHYKRQWRHGTNIKLIDMEPKTAKCSVEDCSAVVFTNKSGLCKLHYTRFLRYGRTHNILASDGAGSINAAGYRIYTVNGKREYAHRLAAEKVLGHPLPEKAIVHHHYGSPSTLVICPDQAYHLLLHRRMKEL